jgi:hypothetical protein
MKKKISWVALLVTVCGALAGGGSFRHFGALSVAGAAPVADPRARTSRPEPLGGIARSMRFGAALVEGTVDKVTLVYDEKHGPRTNFHMNVEKVHAGTLSSNDLTISQFGGVLPDGTKVGASEIPVLAQGRRYLVLVANDTSTAFWSSIVDGYAFAIENISGKDTLVGEDGRLVREISVMGPRFGRLPLFERLKFDGKTFPKPARAARVASADVDDEVARSADVESAISAMKDAAALENVAAGGRLGSVERPGGTWIGGPVEPASEEK